mmetsp:Transcript_16710/g.43170  ORF Transcript_16710/g.43170 Transcript_16710/m.43170 type:complete len:159 (-) Transcript_16710:78-554(-)
MATAQIKGLDSEAAQALKQFANRNRPLAASYLSEAFASEGAPLPVFTRTRDRASTDHPELRDGSGAGSSAASEAAPTGNGVDPTAELPELPASIKKMDIFDSIDEERVADFEQHFEESRKASNYDEFNKKTKKGGKDPGRFATLASVFREDDGRTKLS